VVAVEWDGTDELGRAGVSDDGSASSTFIVPESAPLDTHWVFAHCLGDGAMTIGEEFTVTPSDVVPVEVPNVVGMTEDRAPGGPGTGSPRARGEDRGRGHGPDTGAQRRNPGGPRHAGEHRPGHREPDRVEVPNLLGMPLDEAQGSVESAGLEFGGATGDPAGLVADQSPLAGVDVPRGTTVSVTLAAPNPGLATVPDLVGQTMDDDVCLT
jgi:hypothetical protein